MFSLLFSPTQTALPWLDQPPGFQFTFQGFFL